MEQQDFFRSYFSPLSQQIQIQKQNSLYLQSFLSPLSRRYATPHVLNFSNDKRSGWLHVWIFANCNSSEKKLGI